MNAALFRKIALKTLRIFLIVYLCLLPLCAVAAYFMREHKIAEDGHAIAFPLFALMIAGVVLFFMVVSVLIGATVFLFLWSLFDLMKSEFKFIHNKILWFVLILLLPLVGTIFYLIISPEQKVQPMDKKVSF
jgi:hypothetical protein